MTPVRIIASPTSWIEGEAVRQLETIAKRPGMIRAVGMPGLTPGKGCPVDAVFETEDIIYPDLVGSDIGCGMNFYSTTIKQRRPERLEKKFKGLEEPVELAARFLDMMGVEETGYEHSLGTIGRGNHFAELQVLDEVFDTSWMDPIEGSRSYGVPDSQRDNVYMLIHSGSRGFGEKILRDHAANYQDDGLRYGTPEFFAYIEAHNHASEWASANRAAIAMKIFGALDADGECLMDVTHNAAVPSPNTMAAGHARFLHRKGAIPSNDGPVVIPGSRGAHSYIVQATTPGGDPDTLWSFSHGAGRKMSRKDALIKNQNENSENLTRTKLGSYVICEDKFLLREEAPNAYKNIAQVIQDMADAGLLRVLATLKPVLTYKMRRANGEADNWRERPSHKRDYRERD